MQSKTSSDELSFVSGYLALKEKRGFAQPQEVKNKDLFWSALQLREAIAKND